MVSYSTQTGPFSPSDKAEKNGKIGANDERKDDATVPSQTQLLSFLSESESYGLRCPIDRIDTVQSIFFMAGSHCFKLRREVPTDRSGQVGLTERFELALEEIRLGRHFAPDLYLDLVPVRWLAGRAYVDLPKSGSLRSPEAPPGRLRDAPIIDWLVMLRRFDFSKSYDKLVEIYQPNFSECHQLAGLIASSVETGEIQDPATSWRQHLANKLSGFKPIVRDLDREARQPTLRACLSRAENRLTRLGDVIMDRGERGLLGKIHGNVGLQNVVQMSDGLSLVNPEVCQLDKTLGEWAGDPLYDLASLICELWSRGLTRQANWVFSHYFNGLLDNKALDGLQAMDLYLCVRALDSATRLKSDLANLQRDNAAAVSGCKMTAALKGYAKTVRDSLLLDEARLIVVGGNTHTNRSHLTRLLAPAFGRMPGAMHLSAQQELLTLFEVDEIGKLPLSAFRKSVWRHVYRRLAIKARQAMEAGYSVILEGSFDSELSRHYLTDLARDLGSSVSIHAFYLYKHGASTSQNLSVGPPTGDDLEQQSVSRTGSRSGSEPDTIPTTLAPRGTMQNEDWTRWINLDGSRSAGTLLSQILEHVNPLWKHGSKETLH